MSCYSQIPIFRCDKLTLSLFISLSGSQHDLVFGWQTGRLTSYYACFLCHTNTNTYTHTLQHTKSAVTVSDMPDAFSSWRLIIHPHYGGRHSRQVDMHMHTHTCLVLRLCGQLIPRQIRLQTEISSGQPSNHAHTRAHTHTRWHIRCQSFKVKDFRLTKVTCQEKKKLSKVWSPTIRVYRKLFFKDKSFLITDVLPLDNHILDVRHYLCFFFKFTKSNVVILVNISIISIINVSF